MSQIVKTGVISGSRTLSVFSSQSATARQEPAPPVTPSSPSAEQRLQAELQHKQQELEKITALLQEQMQKSAELEQDNKTLTEGYKQLEQERDSQWQALRLKAELQHEQALEKQKADWQTTADQALKSQLTLLETVAAEQWQSLQSVALDVAFTALCRLVGKHYGEQPFVRALLEQAVADLKGQTHLTLRMRPDDCQTLSACEDNIKTALGCQHITWQPDTSLQNGGVVIVTERGEWDARLDSQIEQIRQLLAGYAHG
ncbi:FliH/SctL family protein [Parendozoicomonas haliclonae]|uniref:Flagellar assembly protein FliH n=1 Tax=Parendozoicomonas haliclonae TaxID=1960125 RepID=A0A1X7ANL1_9GAMM|nr:FliH/SctL family protein [Parendozoicomonas haliclonae]SMA49884.1 flagellar assembly protein H [Parendozoicomonas haliclonae]